MVQIDEIIPKASIIWKKTRYLKNSFARINRFPRELLGHIPTFFESERDLINTTTVCRHWRTTLLSTPQLWCSISGSSAPKIRAYLERSKRRPLNVHLTSPDSARLLCPDIRRVASLHLDLFAQSQMERTSEHLFDPASSLRVLSIHSLHPTHTLEIPPAFLGGSFPSLRTLIMEEISSFSGPHVFPSVTSLTLSTNSYVRLDTTSLVNALGRLPSLETVSIKFRSRWVPTPITGDRTVTLQNLRKMSLSQTNNTGDARMGPILCGLHLPKLERLEIHSRYTLESDSPCFPSSFPSLLPNFSELPKAIITFGSGSCKLHFQSECQHALDIFVGRLSISQETRKLLGGLPLRSVRSLAVGPTERADWEFLFGMLKAMDGIEDLEIGGDWASLLRFWREGREWERLCPALCRLRVYGGEGHEPELAVFEGARRDIGLPLTAMHILRGEDD